MTQRILFFGMEGTFSRAPLLELIAAHHPICAIIVPRPEQSQPAPEPIRRLAPPPPIRSDGIGAFSVPLANEPRNPNIIGIAWNAGIDVYEVATLHSDRTINTIQRFQPDLVVVACFPLLLPNHLITQYPSLNLHPSLLPNHRGPSPLFWILHDGLEQAGVTVHLMDEHADTGDIVAQERVHLPDGIRYADAEKILSEHAARLLIKVLSETPSGRFTRMPQPRTPTPRAPNPSEPDFVIAAHWNVRRAFNFARGIGERTLVVIGNRNFFVREAISFEENAAMIKEMERIGEYWQVRFADGALICKLAESDH